MTVKRDWQRNRDMWIRVLEKKTGESLETWNKRIRREQFKNIEALSAWLAERGIGGYPEQLLIMETFGYPDFVTKSADELIEAQYADRPNLRPIYDAVLEAAKRLGDVIVQARKTYVSLVARRTFARVVPSTKSRVDVGLRISKQKPTGRLHSSKIHETMTLQVSLESPSEVDTEFKAWLKRAWDENS